MAQLGIFRATDAQKAMNDTLQTMVDRHLLDPTNTQEFAAANNYAAKQIEGLSDAAKIAGSALPQFQAAVNEAGSARKQLDSLFVDTMNVNRGFFVEFGQNLRQGMSLWDSFKKSAADALGHIADKLMQMAADNLFSRAFGGSSGGGLFGLLGGLFGFGGSGGGITLGGPGGPTPFAAANGGTFGPGWGVVGERGPELIKVNRGSVTVVPNHISKPYLPGFADGGSMDGAGTVRRLPFGQDNSAGPAVTIVQHNDFRGSDPGSEARQRQYVDQSRKMAVQEAVQAVANVQRTNPAYLRGGR